ncbi:MAG: flavodoxin-dependent (E)-4-hydroxy-3-methylbut-2-enyl-diphosphate synthase, partial [Candidatus Omnitrophica bacterium]|nr:flavodoxin-dependent (E)-4-hydroxy-3-methylbut-2-enyl-diphosphate synthase [Candidatus Omnitrophota bacterium]
LHLGVTATGVPFCGGIKSSIALGALLLDGIGDTIRVSLTDDPREEVKAAFAILESLGLRSCGPQIISCPTCGRCQVNLVKIVKDFEKALMNTRRMKPATIALMGCEVNGPGEAKHADAGIAFGRGQGMLFKKGKAVKKVSVDKCLDVLMGEIQRTKSA